MTEVVLWVLVLTTACLLGERLATHWREPTSGREANAPEHPEASAEVPDLLGRSRSSVPVARPPVSTTAPPPLQQPEAESDYEALTAAFAELADYADEVPTEFERLLNEEVPLAAPTDRWPTTALTTPQPGMDLDAYADRLDELALRVSYLVTGQLRDELEPALKEWVREARLEESGDADQILRHATDRMESFGVLFDRVTES